MGRFFAARGHLSCGFEEIGPIMALVTGFGSGLNPWRDEPDRLALYRSGWIAQTSQINWVGHVFYGASVRADGVDLLKDCLREVAARFPDVIGTFLIDDDEDEVNESVRVHDGVVTVLRVGRDCGRT